MNTFFDIWLPYFYLYAGGGIGMLIGLVIIRKANAINMDLKHHRIIWKVIIFGYFYFAIFHFLLIFAALNW